MKLSILIKALLSFLYIAMGNRAHADLIKMFPNNSTNLFSEVSSAIISCTCNGRTLKEEFPKDDLKAIREDKDFFEYCDENSIPVCDFSRKCENCVLDIKDCSRLSQKGQTSSGCFHRRIKIQKDHRWRKTKISGPYRNRRDLFSGDCVFPSEMKTAELKCTIYSKYIKCRQICLYGYTLQEGISKEMTCYYKTNQWSGSGFRECVPFVDCTMKLASGGKISCVKYTVYSAPHCNVSCAAYEDKKATPMKKYTCTLEPNKWNPDLPHCVTPGSGFVLAPPPRIRDHSKEILEPVQKTKSKKSPSVKLTEPEANEKYAMEEYW